MCFCVSDWKKKEKKESRYDRDRERKNVLLRTADKCVDMRDIGTEREWERKGKKESYRNTDREWKSVRQRERQTDSKRVWEWEFDCRNGREVCVWVC